MKVILTIAIFLSSAACVSFEPKAKQVLTFEEVKKRTQTPMRVEQIKKAFGAPGKIILPKDFTDLEVWIYYDFHHLSKVSFTFNKKTSRLIGKIWILSK